MTCTQRMPIPSDMAARVTRSISRLRIMCMSESPSSPRRLRAGTRHSSNTSSAVVEARMPHLSRIFCPFSNPGAPFSTMNDETRSPSVLA